MVLLGPGREVWHVARHLDLSSLVRYALRALAVLCLYWAVNRRKSARSVEPYVFCPFPLSSSLGIGRPWAKNKTSVAAKVADKKHNRRFVYSPLTRKISSISYFLSLLATANISTIFLKLFTWC